MSTNTPINAIPKPELSDTANIETATHAAFELIDKHMVAVFASTSARDSAITAPTAGMMAYVSGTDELYLYNAAGNWVGARARHFFKSSTQTVTDSVTLTNATNLVFSVEINSRYIFTGDIIYQSTGTSGNDMQVDFTIPAAAAGSYNTHVQADTATTNTGALYVGNTALGTNQVWGTVASQDFRGDLRGYIVTGVNAGSVQFRFAEALPVGGVTSVSINSGSSFTVWKVA